MASNQPPLRILCLHGYDQSMAKFRQKTGGFRKSLKKYATFAFLQAPHIISKDLNEEDPMRGWWFSSPEENQYQPLRTTITCRGFQESLQLVEKELSTAEPQFDGILGFSQGACFLSLICALKQAGNENLKFDFAIFVAGFRSPCSEHSVMCSKVVDGVPSLHVIGKDDRVIPAARSVCLAEGFADNNILYHDGGHYIPTGSSLKQGYVGFLEERIQMRTERLNIR